MSHLADKEAPPIAADPGGFLDFWIFRFFGKLDFWNSAVGFGVWEGLQWMGNCCWLQMAGFSAHFDPYESILNYFNDFGHFCIDSGGLTLFPEGPRTLRDRLEGPRTL